MSKPHDPLTVAIVEDHVLFRAGLRRLLGDLTPTTVLEFDDIDEALTLLSPDVGVALILLNERQAATNAYADLTTLIALAGSSPVVIVERGQGGSDIGELIRRGARGFIAGNSTDRVMVQALRLVLAGGIYVPPSVIEVQNGPAYGRTLSERPPSSQATLRRNLTPRQREVLELIAHGYANKEIAERLGLTIGTVKVHVFKIFKALNVRNRTQAVLVAAELIDLRENDAPLS